MRAERVLKVADLIMFSSPRINPDEGEAIVGASVQPCEDLAVRDVEVVRPNDPALDLDDQCVAQG